MKYYTVVVERESNGTYSAWVPGVPGAYASANSEAQARRGIQQALEAVLEWRATQASESAVETYASVWRLRHNPSARTAAGRWQMVNPRASDLGRRTSPAKARASRANGAKGGRPRKAVHKR